MSPSLRHFALRAIAVLAAGIVIVGLSIRFERRADWTPDARYTLSVGTRELLARQTDDVSILAFHRQGGRERERVRELLTTYDQESARVTCRLVDPEAEPQLAREQGALTDGTIVIEAAGRRATVHRADEETLTGALARLSRSRTPTVRFVTGHGERSVTSASPDGISELAARLGTAGFAVGEILLARTDVDPADADLVVVAGPREDLYPAEIDWLARRLDAGGSVLVLVDPRPTPELERFLRTRGVEALPGIVVDPRTRLWGADATVPVITDYARHPVTDPLQPGGVVPTFFPVARALAPGESEAKITVLLRAGQGARIAEAEIAPSPPLSLALLSAGPGRLLVVGDSDFATNGNLGLSGNGSLALSAIEWLAQDEAAIGILPVRPVDRPRLLTGAEFRNRVTLPALALPLLFAAGGMAALSRRRR